MTQILDALQNSEDLVHIWSSSLDKPPDEIQVLWLTLSAEERARANRFQFDVDRARFIVGRGMLRRILGQYLDLQPSLICLSYGLNGKPMLSSIWPTDALQFNVSHSNSLALYAYTWQRRVGIDLEYVRALLDLDSVANLYLSAREKTALHLLPMEHRAEAYFSAWTCKEAYLKAIGDGLSQSPEEIEVLLSQVVATRFLTVNGSSEVAKGWSLKSFTPVEGYVAALVVEGTRCCVQTLNI